MLGQKALLPESELMAIVLFTAFDRISLDEWPKDI
ncbi:hypothetical protein W822_09405 [Advenella kashmirensis W13003]|uniref:Uncharacterized protein n=1 Tax=Advenella kashmirensis W13003 TaxID=1424334 RepID=V8QWV9_9BURK|nr:hypothetical protein W822_09405 [Advenella kashmirensis W13003]